MGALRGRKEYEMWISGKPLTRMQAMKANCYICNGLDEGAEDCGGKKSCPMYRYFPYKGVSLKLGLETGVFIHTTEIVGVDGKAK